MSEQNVEPAREAETTTAKVQKSYIELRGLNLGMSFVHDNGLIPGQKYPMIIGGLEEGDAEGTLDPSGFIGGLSKLYRGYELRVGDEVEVRFDDGAIRLSPPEERKRRFSAKPAAAEAELTVTAPVFERQGLRHVHIEPFAPGNLSKWEPRTEADVYMVFGALSEYTDYQYCCGASRSLLDRLGYSAETKPDAVLIDRASGQYLMAEFKMTSKEFSLNHKPEDVDVLVCWDDDGTDRSKLPGHIVDLRSLLERAVRDGEIDI